MILMQIVSVPQNDPVTAIGVSSLGMKWESSLRIIFSISTNLNQASIYVHSRRGKLIIARLAMLSTAVSSTMLSSMAEKDGFHHEVTLTGFKWMGNRSLELEEKGFIVPYAFEEAIGYMFGDIVRDKDGIAAASVFLRLTAKVYGQGQTVTSLLNQLYERYYLCENH
jgi:phosphomannomutase